MSSQKLPPRPLRKCPISHHTTDQEDFEHDFTTHGKTGNLGCPFAKMTPNDMPATPNSQVDPIAAEFHQDKLSTASHAGAGQCPIRFLDQHSPEEIAQYFENHKHEIPRSHEICVKRYQQNEHSIRQLDAKYGSLVNMIQGLGVKHKPYLPETERPVKQENSSTGAVEKWAEDVSEQSVPRSNEFEADEEPRISRFGQPLREVRVGESPSRPWGISVPMDKEITPSVLESETGRAVKLPRSDTAPAPAAAAALPQTSDVPSRRLKEENATQKATIVDGEEKRPITQIVFNGPVFFGYSPEQAAVFLQNLNLGDIRPAE